MSSINGISFSGLASGLDSSSIIQKLVALERRPIFLLEDRKKEFSKKRKLFGDLEDKVKALQDAARKLKSTSTILDYKATVDSEGQVTVSAGSGATPGTHTIHVNNLATAEVHSSNGKADKDTTTYGSDLLKFTINGTAKYVTIDSSNNTLEGIATAVNNAGIGITAQVVNTGDATNPYKLIFKSDTEGSAGAFTVSTDSGTGALNTLATEINGNEIVTGQDASFTFDGIAMTRSSNTFSDVVTGLTINLTGAHTNASDKTTITIAADGSATAEKVKAFVDAYNDVVEFIKNQQKVTTDDKAKDGEKKTKTNPLFGDTSLRTIQFGLRSILGSSVSTGNDSYAMLSQVGIESDKDGKLTFDQSKFEEALADDSVAIKKLFADATSGIAQQIYDRTDSYLDPVDGIFKTRRDGIDRTTKQIDEEIRRQEDRVSRYEERLTRRFANLELIMGRLQAMGGSLLSLQ